MKSLRARGLEAESDRYTIQLGELRQKLNVSLVALTIFQNYVRDDVRGVVEFKEF